MTRPLQPADSHPGGAPVDPLRVLLVSTYELGRQPFSLASPAAWLKAAGMRVETLDLAVEPISVEAAKRAHLIAFSVPMHTATRLALHHLPVFRSANPDAAICCFGLYAAMNEEHLRDAGADFVLAGEYEESLVQVARLVDARRRDGKPGQGDAELSLPAVLSITRQDFLVPDRDGLPTADQYARLVTESGERLIAYTEASRGCKHRCRHCPIVPVYNGKFRVVQRDVVLADIRQQVAAGATHVTFGDPDFFNGPAHSMAIVAALHEEFPHVTYDATIKIEHLVKRDGLIPALKETGCIFVTSAVEAFDEPTIDALEKNHTRDDVIRVVQRFREVGLHLSPTFVPFTPWTTALSYLGLLDTVAELDLIDSVAPVQYAIRLLIPRGSRLLELPFVQSCIQPFDPVSLAFPWSHPDAAVDELHSRVLDTVDRGVADDTGRQSLFGEIWSAATAIAGCPGQRPAHEPRPAERVVPHVTEQWYCCAEPTERQLAVAHAVDGDQTVRAALPPSSPPPPAAVPDADTTELVRQAAFLRLLDGEAVTAGYLATRMQLPVTAATAAVSALASGGRAVTDPAGSVMAIAGLSLVETAHRLRIVGKGEAWCWCAWDAFGITSALRLTAQISTRCGHCAEPLVVDVVRGEPAGDLPAYGYVPPFTSSPLSCFCPYALLFCSAVHLGSWREALPSSVTDGGCGLAIAEYAAAARGGWAWAAGEVPAD